MTVGRIILLTSGCGLPQRMKGEGKPEERGVRKGDFFVLQSPRVFELRN